jgi:hypothetical protein
MTEPLSYIAAACLALLGGAVLYAIARAARDVRTQHRQAERLSEDAIAANLRILVDRGYDRGWMIFRDTDGGPFVQFRKCLRNGGSSALESIFPRVAWSEPYYADVHRVLTELGVPTSRVPLREDGAPAEYLRADFGEDALRGAAFALHIFRNVFNSTAETLHIESDGISPFLKAPNRKPGKLGEYIKQWRQELRTIKRQHRPPDGPHSF